MLLKEISLQGRNPGKTQICRGVSCWGMDPPFVGSMLICRGVSSFFFQPGLLPKARQVRVGACHVKPPMCFARSKTGAPCTFRIFCSVDAAFAVFLDPHTHNKGSSTIISGCNHPDVRWILEVLGSCCQPSSAESKAFQIDLSPFRACSSDGMTPGLEPTWRQIRESMRSMPNARHVRHGAYAQ